MSENQALNQARAQMESIAQMVAALSVDYERLAELRELAKAPRYISGWNMPGYMPDSEPVSFDDIDDACSYIADAMESEADDIEPDAEIPDDADPDEAAAARDTARTMRQAAAKQRQYGNSEYGQTIGRFHYWITQDGFMIDEDPAQREELETLENEAGDAEDEDDARQRIHEDPLSIEYRSGWSTDPRELEPEEFCVLLCTGGPAVRIVGELGEHGAIHRAWLEYQDWFTPWTHYADGDSETLIAYCEALNVGEF